MIRILPGPLLALATILSFGSPVFAQVHPSEPYIDREVCPFECCTYREWWAYEALPVYPSEADTTEIAFTLAAGTRFDALTGNVHLKKLGVIRVVRPYYLRSNADSTLLYAPGDTVYVLSYAGEGYYRLLHEGEIHTDSEQWVPESEYDPDQPGVWGILLQRDEPEWWVQIRDREGRTGWIWMDKAEVGNADQCSVDDPPLQAAEQSNAGDTGPGILSTHASYCAPALRT